MKEQWILTLKSIQHDGKERMESELNTQADFYLDQSGDLVLEYDESETTGMEGSHTQLRVSPERMVSVIRTGTFQTHLVVQPNVKHFCHYATPYGDIAVGITAKWVKSTMTETGGHLEMRYTVDANSTLLSDNEIILDVRKKDTQEDVI